MFAVPRNGTCTGRAPSDRYIIISIILYYIILYYIILYYIILYYIILYYIILYYIILYYKLILLLLYMIQNLKLNQLNNATQQGPFGLKGPFRTLLNSWMLQISNPMLSHATKDTYRYRRRSQIHRINSSSKLCHIR